MIYRVERKYSMFVNVPGRVFNPETGDAEMQVKLHKFTSMGPYNWRAPNDNDRLQYWEHKNGFAKYEHIAGYEDYKHPTVYEDPRLNKIIQTKGINYCHYDFGFRDMETLEKWFNANDRTTLARCGFCIPVYQPTLDSEVFHGTNQSLFKLENATLVEIIHFEDTGYDMSLLPFNETKDLAWSRAEMRIERYDMLKAEADAKAFASADKINKIKKDPEPDTGFKIKEPNPEAIRMIADFLADL